MSEAPTQPTDYLSSVRAQYEILPYPPRDPANERTQFYSADALSLAGLSHYGWGGKRDLREGARILVAGQGTGDMTIFLAEQLRDTQAEIVAIDLSTASIAIAKARLAARGLSNVTIHHCSILDLPTAGLGQFDVIECGGVLHHLADPAAGLAALRDVLADDGIILLMVYAFYGRVGLYMTQALMGYLLPEDAPAAEKLATAKAFLGNVPPGHILAKTGDRFREEIQEPTGSGIYDLFLHSTDRAYTVPQLYEWVVGAGLHLNGFCADFAGNARYAPETYTVSPILRRQVAGKSRAERETIAELICGSIRMHHFHVAKTPRAAVEVEADMVMVASFRQQLFPNFVRELHAALLATPLEQAATIAGTYPEAPPLVVTHYPNTPALVAAWDEKRSMAEMALMVATERGTDLQDVMAELIRLYHELHHCQRVFLRHHDIPPYIGWEEIKARLATIPPL